MDVVASFLKICVFSETDPLHDNDIIMTILFSNLSTLETIIVFHRFM